ncbi:MAG: hypothetical protein AUG44_08500 [Actinobacteria bacterium 13_1_20CM_3_71_11]|nr:MAG: hypothetical protein AUG44_08500 [Actinobacteria bacterium 13_1_20CM_3_71_11]
MADEQTVEALRSLASGFWTWRRATAPDSTDDIDRVERPPGWTPDWSAGAIAARRDTLDGLRDRYRALDLSGQPVAIQVNGRLLGWALDRVHWELNLIRAWQANPCFYLDQSLGAVYPLLLVPPPVDDTRAAAIGAGPGQPRRERRRRVHPRGPRPARPRTRRPAYRDGRARPTAAGAPAARPRDRC